MVLNYLCLKTFHTGFWKGKVKWLKCWMCKRISVVCSAVNTERGMLGTRRQREGRWENAVSEKNAGNTPSVRGMLGTRHQREGCWEHSVRERWWKHPRRNLLSFRALGLGTTSPLTPYRSLSVQKEDPKMFTAWTAIDGKCY